jgi:hypothetical protein
VRVVNEVVRKGKREVGYFPFAIESFDFRVDRVGDYDTNDSLVMDFHRERLHTVPRSIPRRT